MLTIKIFLKGYIDAYKIEDRYKELEPTGLYQAALIKFEIKNFNSLTLFRKFVEF